MCRVVTLIFLCGHHTVLWKKVVKRRWSGMSTTAFSVQSFTQCEKSDSHYAEGVVELQPRVSYPGKMGISISPNSERVHKMASYDGYCSNLSLGNSFRVRISWSQGSQGRKPWALIINTFGVGFGSKVSMIKLKMHW